MAGEGLPLPAFFFVRALNPKLLLLIPRSDTPTRQMAPWSVGFGSPQVVGATGLVLAAVCHFVWGRHRAELERMV